jgi:hypothetical protein
MNSFSGEWLPILMSTDLRFELRNNSGMGMAYLPPKLIRMWRRLGRRGLVGAYSFQAVKISL